MGFSVLYDHYIFGMRRYGGISRYFSELIKGMSSIGGIHVNLLHGESSLFNEI